MLSKKVKIFVAGHNGMVGSSIIQSLKEKKFEKIITISKKRLNLLDQNKTFNFLKKTKPDIVIIAAATVGGIHANDTYPVDFMQDNISIQRLSFESSGFGASEP